MRVNAPELDQNSHNAEIDIYAYLNNFGNTGLHLSIDQDVLNFVPNPDRGAIERSGDEQARTHWDGRGPPGQQPLFLSLQTIWEGGEASLHGIYWDGVEEFDTMAWM